MPLSKARDRQRKRFQPKSQQFQPDRYLLAHLKVCPDYNVRHPGDHFKHCPYVNPQFQPKLDAFQPEYDIGYLYSDGRVRLEDMSVVQPDQCQAIKRYAS